MGGLRCLLRHLGGLLEGLGGVLGGLGVILGRHGSPEVVLGATSPNKARRAEPKSTPNGTQDGTQNDPKLKTKFDIKKITL